MKFQQLFKKQLLEILNLLYGQHGNMTTMLMSPFVVGSSFFLSARRLAAAVCLRRIRCKVRHKVMIGWLLCVLCYKNEKEPILT